MTFLNLQSILFVWLDQIIKKQNHQDLPIIVGINGPQGCGKSTTANLICEKFRKQDIRAVSLSIDDFYLTRESQINLATKRPWNPFLQQRGYPGTHDIELGRRTLEALKQIHIQGSVLCPSYDKSKFNGQGDRLPKTCWKKVTAPLELVLLEGWMLGFTPVSNSFLTNKNLREINSELEKYREWTQYLSAFIQLFPLDIRYVLDWRTEAEERMKMTGKPGMSKDEIRAYIEKFLPAYEIYLPHLLKHPPQVKNYIQFKLNKDRIPIADETHLNTRPQ